MKLNKVNYLYRSNPKFISGVCQGLSEYFGVQVSILRLALIIGSVLSFGIALMIYLFFWFVVPLKNHQIYEEQQWAAGSNGKYHPPLSRTIKDRKLLGVCGGLARRLGWDVSWLRLGAILLSFISFGAVLAIYLIACVFIPEDRTQSL